MAKPNWVVTCGMAKEPAWGTMTIPATIALSSPAPIFAEKQTPAWDRGLRGIRSEAQAMVFADGHSEIDIPNMPWYGADAAGNGSASLLMGLMGADAVSGTARTGTIGAVAVGATSVTYTPGTGGASVTGDIFKIDAGLPTQEIVVPTSIAANVWTVPATGRNSFKFAHTASAPAVSLFTHAITVLNSGAPASWTFQKYDQLVATARTIAGVYLESLDLKFTSPGTLTVDAKGRGKMGTDQTAPTLTYPSDFFFVPWQANFTIAGVANARVVDLSLSLIAAADQIFGMASTQSPTNAIPDQLTVTGALTIVPDDNTEFMYYINNTQPAVSFTLDNGSTRATFQMSKVAFIDPVQLNHSGNYSMLNANFEAIANSTDAGTGNAPIKVVTNDLRSTVF